MTVPLVKGQNAPLPAQPLEIRVESAVPTDLSALLVGPTGRVRSDDDFVFYNQPNRPGVTFRPSPEQAIAFDAAAVPADVERLHVAVSIDEAAASAPPNFGAVVPPVARVVAGGDTLFEFTIAGLTTERAIVALELYRRQGAWKVRAIGQGYAGGLLELAVAHGVQVDDPGAAAAPAPAPTEEHGMLEAGGPATAPTPVATPTMDRPINYQRADRAPSPSSAPAPSSAPGLDPREEEKMYRQVRAIFEDAARSTAAFRSATGFAAERRDAELEKLLANPAARNSPETATARAESERKHDELVERATADYNRDITQLATEFAQIEPGLPPAMARWDAPVWSHWQPSGHPSGAIRVGDLHLPDNPLLHLPLLLMMPLHEPLWIDSGEGKRAEATIVARGLVTRFLTAFPAGKLRVYISDPVGSGAAARALDPLAASTAGVIEPAATTPAELGTMFDKIIEQVDLVQMAVRAGATDTLAEQPTRLVVLHDFPYGFDDRMLAQFRFLLDEGPAAGVQFIIVSDPTDAMALGPLVTSLWRSFLRLSAVPDDHLCDPWVGLAWTYTPDDGSDPAGTTGISSVLTRLAR